MTTATLDLTPKVQALRKEARLHLVEREEEIDIAIMALFSKSHAFFYGEPGIAKSLLIDTLAKMISGLTENDYFNLLMMKSTTPEAVFGPLSLTALDEDRYYFMPDGYLPVAKFAFLDEAWKANAAILNSLLWICNERKYRNDGKVGIVPLHSMFIASNEIPNDDSLRAIYDRFPLRKIVNPIVEPSSFIRMMKMEDETPNRVISWEEVEIGTEQASKVVIPDHVYDALMELKQDLQEKEVTPSDRRFKQCNKMIRVNAWMKGQTEADVEDLQCLRFVLWNDIPDFDKVERLCLARSNPIDIEIMDVGTGLTGIAAETERAIADTADKQVRLAKGSELYAKVNEARDELVAINERLEKANKTSAKMEPVSGQLFTLSNRILTKLFGTSVEDLKQGMDDFANLRGDFK